MRMPVVRGFIAFIVFLVCLSCHFQSVEYTPVQTTIDLRWNGDLVEIAGADTLLVCTGEDTVYRAASIRLAAVLNNVREIAGETVKVQVLAEEEVIAEAVVEDVYLDDQDYRYYSAELVPAENAEPCQGEPQEGEQILAVRIEGTD